MKAWPLFLLVMSGAAAPTYGQTPLQPDPPKTCDSCEEWNAPREPFRVFGNTYYVGVAGLGAVLIAPDKDSKDSKGSILLDGGLPQSSPLIDASIRKLGFRTEDIRLIVNSHAHDDHAGGIPALQRASGAVVAASPSGADALERGERPPDDPQYLPGLEANRLPRAKDVRRVADGEILRVGALAIQAHLTPGHTPGSTTWTWRSCEGELCLDIVYADSLNAVSEPGFRFTGDLTHASLVDSFRRSIAIVEGLPCDILLSVHPGFSGMDEKLKRRALKSERDPFIDPQACRAYAADARQRLDRRIEEEGRTAIPPRP